MWYLLIYLIIGILYFRLNMNMTKKRKYDMAKEAKFNDLMNRIPPDKRAIILTLVSIYILIFWFYFFIIDTYEIWTGKDFGVKNDQ